MASEPPQPPAALPARDKMRVRFQKRGELRLVSHRDLVKCFERMCRRAELPVAKSQGFHPKPRLVFPLSLALGVVGLREAVELVLEGRHEPAAVQDALARQSPPGLYILSVQRIDLKTAGQPRCVRYRVALPPHRNASLPERIGSLLNASECWVERTRPQSRRFDLKPLLHRLRLNGDALAIDLWVTPGGMARPEEVLGVLGLADLLDETILERTDVELHDETPTPGPVPQIAFTHADGPGSEAPVEKTQRPTSLLPGPLSFDS